MRLDDSVLFSRNFQMIVTRDPKPLSPLKCRYELMSITNNNAISNTLSFSGAFYLIRDGDFVYFFDLNVSSN